LSDERLRELLEVQAYFGLPSPALVEKDFYVVKALAAIAAIETTPLRLVFGGSTALSRAYRLVRRMSEDIDLRIVSDRSPGRGALRRLRDAVTQALLNAGFKFDPEDPGYRESATKAATRSTGCLMSRRQRERGPCGRRSRSRPRCGRCVGRPSSGR
jgi:hypothetical protein